MICKIICSILALTAFCASAIEIKLPENPSVHEKNAAALLQKHADKIDKDSKTLFNITLAPDMEYGAWSVSSEGKINVEKRGNSTKLRLI